MSKLDPKDVSNDLLPGAVFVQNRGDDDETWLQILGPGTNNRGGKLLVRCLGCGGTGNQRRSRVIQGRAFCPRCAYISDHPGAELRPLDSEGWAINPNDDNDETREAA